MSSPYVPPAVPSAPLEVRSRNIDRQFIPAAIAIGIMGFLVIPLVVLSLSLDPGFGAIIGLLLFSMLGIVVWYGIWRYRNATGSRTIVDGRGLWLQQLNAPQRFVPWDDASGRVTVKAINQYTPWSSGPTTTSLVCLTLDQEELVLPGTIVTASGSTSAVQQSYATAMQILAYDPWGQSEPLMRSENTFAAQPPQTTVIYNGYPGYNAFG